MSDTQLLRACEAGQLKTVQSLLKANPKLLNAGLNNVWFLFLFLFFVFCFLFFVFVFIFVFVFFLFVEVDLIL